VPRQPPFTLGDIKARERLGLGPTAAIPNKAGSLLREVGGGSHPCPYNFVAALEILGLGWVGAETKRRYEFELAFICRAHKLAVRAEKEETAARKAEAFQKAPRLHRRRQLALKRIAAIRQRMGLAPEITRGEMLPAGNDSDRETIRQTRQALGVLRDGGWLPQSLEQEVMDCKYLRGDLSRIVAVN
jgi:hypothetical protein